ncbi:MAG: tRNA 2-thiouridine(34) synthase MnmA [bacterium]|nr:tRNA 2-thiouridine(34) synthase MnmA [bacterium]
MLKPLGLLNLDRIMKPENKNKLKVIMAMSGGIDSSVAAALLKKQDFEVVGVFMKFWKEPDDKGGWNRCCSLDSERRARQVAKVLKIPFYVFNFEKEFKRRIVDYFLAGYKRGLTPNPCVVCNKEIKFGLLLERAMALNADFIATGHYVRLSSSGDHAYKLLKGNDKEKDQSYFLWQLNQKKLKKIIFPVGEHTKPEVRKLANKFKLPFKNIPESMEICFIPKTTEEFLGKYLKSKPGQIMDGKGKLLGRHPGLQFFTIGQRKGIQLSGGPFWVTGKDLRGNRLIVSRNEKDLLEKESIVEEVNWISGKEPKLPLKMKVKIRYRHESVPATVFKIRNARYKIRFGSPQRAVTPGQSAVFYQGRELLGGGIIN